MFKRYFAYFQLLLPLIVATGYLLSPSYSHADYTQNYANYINIYEEYRIANGDYLTTKNQYLTYNTLTAKNEALSALKRFLVNRNSVLQSYFGLLHERSTDVSLNALIDSELAFFNLHTGKIGGIATLEDGVIVSKEVESKHVQFQAIAKKTLGMILVDKLRFLKQQNAGLQNEARGIIDTLRQNGKDTTTLERWLIDAKNKELLADEKMTQAVNLISKMQGTKIDQINQQYTEIQFTLLEANQYMRESGDFIKELAELIKYGDY